jgi:hypothetical protein
MGKARHPGPDHLQMPASQFPVDFDDVLFFVL